MTELTAAPSEDDVMEALSNVIDPELGLDFVELGLIYGVEVAEGRGRGGVSAPQPAEEGRGSTGQGAG